MGRHIFKLPDVGEGTAEAEIVAWHVAVGDKVEEDQHLVDVMTDKATVEMTSPVSGVVVSLHGAPGDMAPVGAPLVEFDVEGAGHHVAPKAAVPAPVPAAPKKDVPLAAAVPSVTKEARVPDGVPPPIPRPQGAGEIKKVLASPAVRQRGLDLGVELKFVTGTGPAGRITHQDLDAYLQSRSAPRTPITSALVRREGTTEIKVIGLRRRIAQKMQESKQHIPHYAYVEEIDMTELENLRAHMNATKRSDLPKLNVLPFLMRALVKVMPDFPEINAHFDDEAGIVHRYEALHIGIATQTANGLIVPVVRHAEARDLFDSAAEVSRVAGLARDNKAGKDDLSGSTITITSLGALGGLATTPVINRPEVAIIGPNAIVERPVVRDGRIEIRKMMNLSSSFDHRVVDGFDAARFIQALKSLLEHPATIFMG